MTIIPYTPSQFANFQFQPTLDGNVYAAVVTWGLFGRRPYLNLYGLDGTLIVSKAIVGSPAGVAIQALAWSGGKVSVTTANPHGYKVLTSVNLVISGVAPDAYNGQVEAFITGPATLTYPLPTYPGSGPSVLGAVSYDIDLVSGYFTTSRLVFRAPANQFVVSP